MNGIVHPLKSQVLCGGREKNHGKISLMKDNLWQCIWDLKSEAEGLSICLWCSVISSQNFIFLAPCTLRTKHNMQLVLTSANCDSIGTPYRLLSSNKSSTYSVLSICRKMLKSWSVSWIATSTAFSCRKCTWLSRTSSGAISSGTKVSVVPFVFR